MSYNSNKSYESSVSYSFSSSSSGFSEYTPTSNQIEYANNTVVSYSGNSNINYNTSAFSDNVYKSGKGSNGSYMVGNASGRGIGKGGGGKRVGKGGGKGMGARSGGRGIGQGCINIPNQFREDQKNEFQSDEVDLASDKIQQTDSDIKTQKNPLDIMIEKLEEKSKREQKKQHNRILKEKSRLLK